MKYVVYGFLGFLVLVLIIVLFSALGWGTTLVNTFMGNTVQRIGVQQSLPYIQTKQAELVELVQQVRAMDSKIAETDDTQLAQTYRAQRQAIINKIEQDRSFIPADQVPVEARQY